MLFALVLRLGAVSLPLGGTARQPAASDVLNDVMVALLTLVLAGMGLLVAWHQPPIPLGWLMLSERG